MSTNNNDINDNINSDGMNLEQLLAENQRLRAEKQRLAELKLEKQRLVAKKQRLIYEGSIDQMINEFDGIPDMPLVKGLFPHEDRSRQAKSSVDPNFVTSQDLNFGIKLTDKNGFQLRSFVPNHQLTVKDGVKILSYHNEVTVCDYVQDVVKMSLRSLGYFDSCFVFKEMSLFSLRHDLIVVLHPEKGIILIIQVKMPGDNLFQSTHIAGQVADYLMAQYRLGNPQPLVLLSSYREACLCRLKPESLNGTEDWQVGDGGENTSRGLEEGTRSKYREIVQQGVDLIRSGTDPGVAIGDDVQQQKNDNKLETSPEKRTRENSIDIPSPLKKTRRTRNSGKSEKNSPKRKKSPTIEVVRPEVVYSRPFTLKNMMQGVTLSIACSLVCLKQKAASPAEEIWPKQQSALDGLHPYVDENTLKWAKVKDMCIDYMNHPFPSTTPPKYCLVREIGQGYNARVYLGVDEYGQACVLKFYLGTVDAETTALSPEERKKKRTQYLEETRKEVEDEVQRWKDLQGDYKDYVEHVLLNAQNVLKMPVFAPVPLDNRSSVLGTVEKKLLEFFRKGYVYNEVHWQHIGCRRTDKSNELEIALLDLESLHKVSSETSENVQRQIKSLKARMGSAPASGRSSVLWGAPLHGM